MCFHWFYLLWSSSIFAQIISFLTCFPASPSFLPPHFPSQQFWWHLNLWFDEWGRFFSIVVYDGWQYFLIFLLSPKSLQNVTPLKVPGAWNLATQLMFACSQKVVSKSCRLDHCHSNLIPATLIESFFCYGLIESWAVLSYMEEPREWQIGPVFLKDKYFRAESIRFFEPKIKACIYWVQEISIVNWRLNFIKQAISSHHCILEWLPLKCKLLGCRYLYWLVIRDFKFTSISA